VSDGYDVDLLGAPYKRVRDNMSEPRVERRVKLYDTASFTVSSGCVTFFTVSSGKFYDFLYSKFYSVLSVLGPD
jgi:hypothetical protein